MNYYMAVRLLWEERENIDEGFETSFTDSIYEKLTRDQEATLTDKQVYCLEKILVKYCDSTELEAKADFPKEAQAIIKEVNKRRGTSTKSASSKGVSNTIENATANILEKNENMRGDINSLDLGDLLDMIDSVVIVLRDRIRKAK